jgi:hypothetical protein
LLRTLARTLRGASRRPNILLTSTDGAAVRTEQLPGSGVVGFIPKTQLARSELDTLLKR